MGSHGALDAPAFGKTGHQGFHHSFGVESRALPIEHVKTLIIGGGQAGLMMSHIRTVAAFSATTTIAKRLSLPLFRIGRS